MAGVSQSVSWHEVMHGILSTFEDIFALSRPMLLGPQPFAPPSVCWEGGVSPSLCMAAKRKLAVQKRPASGSTNCDHKAPKRKSNDIIALSQQELRRIVYWGLDIPIKDHDKQDGVWVYLTVAQMAEVRDFRLEHMKGKEKTREWASNQPSDETNVSLAYAFWAGSPALPDQCRVGLESAVRKAGFEVHLLVYDMELQNVPSGVSLVDASKIVRRERFTKAVSSGVSLPQLSDWVRCKAILNGQSGGWLIDCDSLWLRPPAKQQQPWKEPSFGHVFASMDAGEGRRSKLESWRHWSVHFLRSPLDKLFIASPFFFPAGSLCLEDLVHTLDSVFSRARCHRLFLPFIHGHCPAQRAQTWLGGRSG